MKTQKKPANKRSLNAKAVAQDVIESIRTGKKTNISTIVANRGYAKSTIHNPQRVTNTLSYKEEIEPVVEQLIKLRQRVINAMMKKDLEIEQFNHLNDSADKLTRNIQLLSGGATEKHTINIEISEAIAKKNQITK